MLKLNRALLIGGPLLFCANLDAGLRGPIARFLPQHKPTTKQIKAAASSAALKHGLNPGLYLAILQVESNFNPAAYNARTHDTGLAQVNKHTARAFNFNSKRLKQDYMYNLEAGAIILADFRDRYATREPLMWPCRYNVGSGRLEAGKLTRCMRYMDRLKAAGLTHF